MHLESDMNIRISNYKLDGWGNEAKDIVPGVLVCPANGCSSIGTIVEVGKIVPSDYHTNRKLPEDVTVLWGSPVRKKGKRTKHSLDTLVDINRYLSEVREQVNAIETMIAEAKTLGL